MIFKRVVFLCFIYMLSGCGMESDMNIEKEIITLIENKCDGVNECLIDLSDLPTFKWDNAYVFTNVSKGYIQSIIKVQYDLYKDIGVKIIFINNGKIVHYQELFPPLNGKGMQEKVTFSFFDFQKGDKGKFNYFHLTPEQAKVKVIKQVYSNDGESKIIAYTIYQENAYQQGN